MNNLELYTDGSCLKNPGQGAYSAILIDNNEKKIFFLFDYHGDTTNNKMELSGAIYGLKFLRDKKKYTNLNVNLYIDSQYVKNGINEWIKNWEKNNWRTASKSPVKNQELWVELNELNSIVKPSWHWVKGHSDSLFNNIVDKVANTVASRQQKISLNEIFEIVKSIKSSGLLENYEFIIYDEILEK